MTDGPSGLVPVLASKNPAGDHLANRLYTASELMRLTGMTRKQVTYWDRIGLVVPMRNASAQSGRSSLFYPVKEVVKAMVVCDLRRAGFTPTQVQKVAKNLHECDLDLYDSQPYILTDGYSVYYAFSDGEVVDVLKNHRQSLLLVPVSEHVDKLRSVA